MSIDIPGNHRYKFCKQCCFFVEQGRSRCKIGLGKCQDDTGLDGKCYVEIAYEQGWEDRDKQIERIEDGNE